MTRKGILIAAFVILAGPAILAWSMTYTTDYAQWSAEVLIGIGSAFMLFIPLYGFGRALDRHIDSVKEETVSQIDSVRQATTNQVEELSERVSSFEGVVEKRLEEVAASVSERLEEERRRDLDVFRALGEAPTREGLTEALERAEALQLLDHEYHPRVRVAGIRDLYVAVYRPSEDEQWKDGRQEIEFVVQDLYGHSFEWIGWKASESLDDVMVGIGRAIQVKSPSIDFSVQAFFEGLSELLQVALSAYERRPIIELCPAQWAITRAAAVTYGDNMIYVVSIHKLQNDKHFSNHVRRKPWIDEDSFDAAEEVLVALFGRPIDPPF